MPLVTLEDCEIRSDGFSKERKEQFLALFLQCKNLALAAETVGVHLVTVYRHIEADEWFNQQVQVVKRQLAWSLVPRQYERAMQNSTTDAIWLQKVMGGAEFNPDRVQQIVNHGTITVTTRGAFDRRPTQQVVSSSPKHYANDTPIDVTPSSGAGSGT